MRFNVKEQEGKVCNGTYCTVSFSLYAISWKFMWRCDMDIALQRLSLLGLQISNSISSGKNYFKVINKDTRITPLNVILISFFLTLSRYFPVMF